LGISYCLSKPTGHPPALNPRAAILFDIKHNCGYFSYPYAEVLKDPQNLANDYVMEMDVPVVGKVKTVGPLVHFSDTPAPDQRLPPALSADTANVMQELGFTADEATQVINHAEGVRAELLAAIWGED